jgi:glycosyltransferase involved in cell wall biosynthesis
VFVGDDGGDRQSADRLRELGRRHRLAVRICGYRPDAARLMPAFDVLAVTSRAEPFGLVTAEALARGVPVVATRSGGSREIIRDGREGLLVAPGDPRALARAISRLLAEHDLRARCTAAGPRRVAACFTHARQLADTEQVYRLALAGSPLPRTMAPVADWCPGREE